MGKYKERIMLLINFKKCKKIFKYESKSTNDEKE
jgi:hypothetical protein